MSDQRRFRHDLHTGLHQFAMHMYQSYLENHSEQEAKTLVVEALIDQLEQFGGQSGSAEKEINEAIEKIKAFRSKHKDDYTLLIHYADMIDQLRNALDILKGKIPGEED